MRRLTLAVVLLWLAASAASLSCAGGAADQAAQEEPTQTIASPTVGPGRLPPTPDESTASPGPVTEQPTASPESVESPTAAPEASPSAAVSSWELTFDLTGGFAGLARRLSVDSRGEVTAEDLRSGRVVPGELSPEALAELLRLLEASSFLSRDASQVRACADCFNYDIRLRLDGLSRTVQANSLGLDPGSEPVVQWLADLLGRELGP